MYAEKAKLFLEKCRGDQFGKNLSTITSFATKQITKNTSTTFTTIPCGGIWMNYIRKKERQNENC